MTTHRILMGSEDAMGSQETILTTHRILTTHVGSLPRPERVVTQLFAQDSGLNYVESDFDSTMAAEVAEGHCTDLPPQKKK